MAASFTCPSITVTAARGAAMRIETDELEAFHEELAAKCNKNARPGIEKMSWGSKDMSVTDPFGNRLTFTNAIST